MAKNPYKKIMDDIYSNSPDLQEIDDRIDLQLDLGSLYRED